LNAETAEVRKIPIVDGVFTWPSDDPKLIASRCKICNTVIFPKSPVCRNPNCKDKMNVEEILLSRRGKLLTFTLVYYPPPPPYVVPDPFVPYAIGEVAFQEGIAVLGQMTEYKYEDLKIGMEVEMVLDKIFDNADGNEVITWKFRPV